MGRVSLRCGAVTTEVTTLDATSSTLAASVRGSGRAVTLVHGFAQTRDCLGPLADVLAARCRLITPDAPGHGGSLRHADAGLEPGAQLLAATGAQGVYVGYSMGGRLCLRAALDRPDAVRALVLIGATAGIEGHDDRAERRRADAALADRLELVGVDTFVEEWLSLPLFAGLPAWARFDRERRTNTAAGSGRQPPPRGHRFDGAACGTGWTGSRCRCCASRARTTSATASSPDGWSTASGPVPATR